MTSHTPRGHHPPHRRIFGGTGKPRWLAILQLPQSEHEDGRRGVVAHPW